MNRGSHLQFTRPPTITPPEVRVDLGTQESLVACRPEGNWVPMLNSAPETEEATIQGANQQPTIYRHHRLHQEGRILFLQSSLTPLVRGNNLCSMIMINVRKVVVFCIVMLMCVY